MSIWQDIERSISDATHTAFRIEQHNSVAGGCINSACVVRGAEQDYFVKLNQRELKEMFIAEADGLREIQKTQTIRVPTPICIGTSHSQVYLVLEKCDFVAANTHSMQKFAQQLAAMHRITQAQYGWYRDNTIGSSPQPNTLHSDWIEFWQQSRLGHQLELAGQAGYGGSLQRMGDKLMEKMPGLFNAYQPLPALLHGDLWSGNYSILASGEPIIFDPAVYYGDREADIAMTALFGGFSQDFYAAYEEAWPLDTGFAVRKIFYNIYHIVNHLNLFGGAYGSQAEAMMEQVLAELG